VLSPFFRRRFAILAEAGRGAKSGLQNVIWKLLLLAVRL
jgi:hypothetical protein